MQAKAARNEYLLLEDEALVRMCADGDEDALAALIVRYTQTVRKKAACIHLPGTEHDDVAQEGMIGLLDAIRTYRPDGGASFRTYAGKCVDHRLYKAAAHAQTGGNRTLHSAMQADPASMDEVFDEGDNPETIVIENEKLQLINHNIQTLLSPFERETLVLYLTGCGYEEMASRLGTSQKAIDNALQRVRRKLKTVFM